MKKRIYYYLTMLTSIIVIITTLVMTLLFFEFYRSGLNLQMTFFSFMVMFLPAVVGILVFLMIFMYLFSFQLTSSILKPLYKATQKIENILSDDEDIEYESSYEELDPFIRTIQSQKKEIEKSMTKLKNSEKYRREFTANVSHELKTPLTSINGYAEMIGEGIANKEDSIRFAKIIQKEGARLLELIDSIIILSKLEEIEGNKVNMTMESVNLYELTKSVYGRFEHIAKEKMINIMISGESIVISGNRRMLEDLISNLMDNSIKYNRQNGIVNVSIYKSDKKAIFKISDTGIGIPKEDQERIFERFYRVDKSRSKRITGTGIGLSIVKHIVEYHNGQIVINSEVDKGTEIEISLPLV